LAVLEGTGLLLLGDFLAFEGVFDRERELEREGVFVFEVVFEGIFGLDVERERLLSVLGV